MVRAILEGRKTQTRRLAKYIPALGRTENWCPYGQIGDRLWVRETFLVQPDLWERNHGPQPIQYAASTRSAEAEDYVGKPSIHMPRWASRITLEITDARVERLQMITEEDAIAEGCDHKVQYVNGTEFVGEPCCKHDYANLWNGLHAANEYGWTANPWVLVLGFKRVEASAQ